MVPIGCVGPGGVTDQHHRVRWLHQPLLITRLSLNIDDIIARSNFTCDPPLYYPILSIIFQTDEK
jgi:hypothetical protein